MPGSFGATDSDDGAVAFTQSSARTGVFGRNDDTNPAPAGTVGGNGVFGLSTVPNASGVFGANNGGGTGVFGESARGDGVTGATQSSARTGVFGRNDDTNPAPAGTVGGNGVFGLSTVPNASGVFGANNGGGTGVFGESARGDGVTGATQSSARTGVFGRNDDTNPAPAGTVGGNGVFGLSTVPNASGVFGANNGGGTGVFGNSDGGDGVSGATNASGKSGVVGINNSSFDNANGVFGFCRIAGNAIHGVGGTNAGLFEGTVVIQGGSLNVKKSGEVGGEISAEGGIFSPSKHFVIDHPCDPANKFLHHCSVESPEMVNVYNGNVTTNVKGEAWVDLPNYFDALNCDFRYQLTAIGQFAQAIVATEIAENRFCIRTDRPTVKVSWQVSGVRKDVYAKANPVVVEQEKLAEEKGFYLHPRLYGQPQEKGLAWVRDRVTIRAA